MVQLVKPENTLKKKVGHGGFKEADLVKAEAAIEKNEIDFKPIADELAKELDAVLSKIQAGKISPADSVASIMDPLMQLRAQGALFRYPSVTDISDIIVNFLEGLESVDKDALDIVLSFRKSIGAVLSMKIQDASNPAVKELCKELSAACQRYAKANTTS